MLLQSDVFIWNQPIECLSRGELEQWQLKRLREQVSRLSATVPFYREALAAKKLTAESIGSLDDLRRLPLTTKADLRDGYPFGFLSTDKANVKRLHASSGTRGKPTIAAYSQNDALKQRLGLTAMAELLEPDTLPRAEGKAHRILDLRTKV